MTKLKKFASSLNGMCEPSKWLLLWSLRLSCVLLLCSIAVFISCGGLNIHKYENYLLAVELYKLPQSVLLIAAIGSVCIEDYVRKKG